MALHKRYIRLELDTESSDAADAAAQYLAKHLRDHWADGNVYELQSHEVAIFGPNLSRAGQAKATFHIHKLTCKDCKDYGPDRKFGGEDEGWNIEADTKAEVVYEVYADQINEGASYESCRMDLWFAPCLNTLPEGSEKTDAN